MQHDTNSSIDCHWWHREPNSETACCGLLQKLTGLTISDHCRVNPDACAACVKWYPPSPQHLNPVVASLLYTVSVQLIESGGCAGCTAGQAAELRQRALSAIPHDYDAVPVAEQVGTQQNLDLRDLGQLIPRPERRYGSPVRDWAVAVTTAPRNQATLDHCIASILAAGWPNPRIIADGEVDIADRWADLPVTRRIPRIGAWPSYYLTLVELMMRQPEAAAYMIVQDDVVLFEHVALRAYLESVLWPDRRPGIVSLFCSRAYAQPGPGWFRLERRLVWGGQALIFSRETAIHLVADLQVVRHRFSGDRGLANIDGLIGRWAFETDTPVHVSSPSLAQHIGHVSSLWQNAKAFVNRGAAVFAGNFSCSRAKDAAPRRSS